MSSDDQALLTTTSRDDDGDGVPLCGIDSPGAFTTDETANSERFLAEQLAALEAEKLEQHQNRMRKVIEQLFEDPFKRNRKVIILKAFMRWAKVLPLNLKCDELAKQLQDRIGAFFALRDSYYRDVVSIKLHLEKVKDFRFGVEEGKSGEAATAALSGEIKAAQELQKDLYSVHALPLIDFRQLIDRAARGTNESSIQLTENLIQAGILNVTTGKAYNSWEKSKAFPRLMKQKKGAHFKMPKTDGESIPAAHPQTHEMFVKYCKSCVGIMQFTRTWNKEVEDALHLKSITSSMEKEISDLKFTVVSMTRIVQDQEIKLHVLADDNKKLVDASEWMGKWSYQKDMHDREAELHEQIRILKAGQGMLYADQEAAFLESHERRTAERERAALREARLNSRLASETAAKEDELHQRMLMLESVTRAQRAEAEKDETIAALRAENADMKTTLTASRESIASLTKTKEDLTAQLAEAKERYEKHKLRSEQLLDNTKFELDVATKDLTEKAEILETLYTQIREEKRLTRQLQDRCDVFDEQQRKEEQHRQWLASRPKYKFRTIALTVRCAVRLSHAAASVVAGDFSAVAPFGRRAQIQAVHNSYSQPVAELAASKTKIADQAHEIKKANNEIAQLLAKNTTANSALATIREQNKGLQAVAGELRAEVKAKEADIAALNTHASAYCKKIDQIKRVLYRTRASAQMQRVLARSLSRSITRTHAILRALGAEVAPTLPRLLQEDDAAKEAAAAAAANALADKDDAPMESGSAQVGVGVSGNASVASSKETSAVGTVPLPGLPAPAPLQPLSSLSDDEAALLRAQEATAAEAARLARLLELKNKFKAAFVSLVKWLRSVKKDRAFEGAALKLPVPYREMLPPLEPNKEFDKLFKDTSKKMIGGFFEDRKKLNRQSELLVAEAQSVSTFAAQAREIIARFHYSADTELRECRAAISQMLADEARRLKAEAKAKKRAEAKRRKEEEKKKKFKERQESKRALKGSLKAGVDSTGQVARSRKKSTAAHGNVDGNVDGEADLAEGSMASSLATEDQDAPFSARPQPTPKPSVKNPGFMSMNFSSGGGQGGAPSGKAKEEVDLSFLDKPERAPIVRQPKPRPQSDSDSDSEEEDEEDDEEEIPNAELEAIDELEEEIQELQLEKARLLETIEEGKEAQARLKDRIGELNVTIQDLHGQARIAKLDLDAAKSRIRLLKDAVEDNYRQRSTEVEEIKRGVAEAEADRAKQIKAMRRHRGTQIACSVCAIRAHGAADQDDDAGDSISLSTGVTMHAGMNEALGGEYVLLARPKNINEAADKSRVGRNGGTHALKPTLAATTHFSDERRGSLSQSQSNASEPLVDPVAAQAQELAYMFAKSKAEARMQAMAQAQAQGQGQGTDGERKKKSAQAQAVPESRTHGHFSSGREAPPPGLIESQRPLSAIEQSQGKRLYEARKGYAHAQGHTLDEDARALPGSGKFAALSEAAGVRDAYDARRADTNTAAFLQAQLLHKATRPKSSIPAARAPVPPGIDSAVAKRQLAPVPNRSQSASELISHLRRSVATASAAAVAHDIQGEAQAKADEEERKPSLVEMEKRFSAAQAERLKQLAKEIALTKGSGPALASTYGMNILTKDGTVINVTTPVSPIRKTKKGPSGQRAKWDFGKGDFEYHSGRSLVLEVPQSPIPTARAYAEADEEIESCMALTQMPVMPIRKRHDDDDEESGVVNDTNHGFGGGHDLNLDEGDT